MDLETLILSQSDKDKNSITYMESKKKDTNELIYKTETDSQGTNLWSSGEKGEGEG